MLPDWRLLRSSEVSDPSNFTTQHSAFRNSERCTQHSAQTATDLSPELAPARERDLTMLRNRSRRRRDRIKGAIQIPPAAREELRYRKIPLLRSFGSQVRDHTS